MAQPGPRVSAMDPTSVTHDAILAAVQTLGIDTSDVRAVTISISRYTGSISIERNRRDGQGRLIGGRTITDIKVTR